MSKTPLRWLAAALLAAPLLLLFTVGYTRWPAQWWYPFVTSLFADVYTTGPFAMTSNTREDNPAWRDIPAINAYLARLSVAMSQGEAAADVAWLFPQAEWLDQPAIGEGLTPNRHESSLSRMLVQHGLVYGRISRRMLAEATVRDGQLQVGAARYRALLVSDWAVADPAQLEQVIRIAAAGVPVVWRGSWPERAEGWAGHAARDAAVVRLQPALAAAVQAVNRDDEVPAALARAGVSGVWGAGRRVDGVRVNRRELPGETLWLFFNESPQPLALSLPAAPGVPRALLLDPASGSATPLDPAAPRFTLPPRRAWLVRLQHGDSRWDEAGWQQPPMANRPYVRWWWPGNAVDRAELQRELQTLHDAGFGGVELQTLTIGLPLQHLREHEAAIYQVGTPAYLDNLRFVMDQAAALGLRVDITMGSGWPNGGPFIDRHPEQQLLHAAIDLNGPSLYSGPLPVAQEPPYVQPTNWIIRDTIGPFDPQLALEAVVAARLDESTDPPTLADFTELTARVRHGELDWNVPAGRYRLFAFYRNATQHNLVASAFPGARQQSRVLDHLDPGGAQEYIDELGTPWLQALAPARPDALFIDSFELIAELPWSARFREHFRQQHGYDLAPYLPLVWKEHGESKYLNMVIDSPPAYQADDGMATRIREDYESARASLFHQAFVQPLAAWMRSQGVALRLQAHGGYGDVLDDYRAADIPETEGLFGNGSFEFIRLAASAAHVGGRQRVSMESFITMSLDFNALTTDDYYFLGGHAYAAGVTHTIYHGYAYHYPLPR